MKQIGLLCMSLLLGLAPRAMSETLTVSYLERPPYYFTQRGEASGILVELASRILRDAAVEVSFTPMPPKRIMHEIKTSKDVHCSVGWFKKPEREAFAKFTLALYQNRPISVLTSMDRRSLFESYKTLKDVFLDKLLIMATISSFSYGSYIDDLIQKMQPRIHVIPGERRQLPKLIRKGRATYLLTAPEEVDMLLKSAGFNQGAFVSMPMKDIPFGNKRYLMCSKNVSDEMIERINRSILRFVDREIAKN